MNSKLYILLLALFCFAAADAFGQGYTVSGTVTDASTGESLPGTTVSIPALNRGSVTDLQGQYSINLPAGEHQVVVSFIGYQRFSRTITITDQDITLDIELSLDIIGLDRVVVVGFGETSRRNVTGAIASVRGEEIQFAPVNSVENAMQGRTAGVHIQQDSGKLGQGIQMRIRGASSVTASNQPLYVIDGVPIVMDNFSISSAATNPLAQFNFNDVESIQVLKDASAAAIYGSRAANGVVLITTRQGRAGRTMFNYSFQQGFSEPTNTVEMMNAKEYINYMYQGAINGDRFAGTNWRVPEIEWVLDTYSLGTDWRQCLDTQYGGAGQECVVDTDWQSEAFQEASMFSHDLSASGGNDATRFYVSGHYGDQDGILINDRFQRISARVNLDHKATEKLNLGMNLSTGRSFHQRLSTDNAFSTPIQLIAQMPMSPLYYPEQGSLPNYVPSDILNDDTYYYNGVLHRDFTKYEVTSMRTTGNFHLAYNILPQLEWRSEVSADILTGKDDQWYSPRTARGFATAANGGYASVAWQQTASYTTAHFMTYNSALSQNSTINATAGFSYQYDDYNYSFTSGSGFPNDSFQRLTSAANVLAGSTTGSEYSFISYFARGNYTLFDRYLFSVSGRVDGSSRFGRDNRYGFFPAASVGWIMTDEDFAESFNDILTYLKLRTSYGITGNAAISNFGSLGLWGGTAYAGLSGTNPSQIPNPNLTWETTHQFNVGFDYGILNNRISGEFDYYIKETEDLLLSVQIPSSSGFSTTLQNVGNMENKGWELVINTINMDGRFQWTSNFNISSNKNKITNLDGQVITAGLAGLNRAMEGYAIGVFYAPEFFGVDPDNGNALFSIYDDEDTCSNFVETTTNFNAATRCVIGNPNPDFVGGFGNTLNYRGFELNVLFQFVSGSDAYIGGHGRWSRGNGIFEDNSTRDQLNSWTPQNTNTNVPEARYIVTNGNQHSSRYISDSSYIRLKNVTFGYELPVSSIDRLGLNKVRLYVTGVNLLTWTDYEGWDPEMNTDFLAGNISQGTDFYTAPQSRTLTFGIDIGF